jgi:hypothetical protein
MKSVKRGLKVGEGDFFFASELILYPFHDDV